MLDYDGCEVIEVLINEASKKSNLTKKAIEYYVEQKLICPVILENGYRDFSQSDLECLTKISVLRKLGICTQDIKATLADDTGDTLQYLSVRKELNLQNEQAKKAILDKLCSGKSYSEISSELEAVEQSATVTEKLLAAFPGYFGRFICLHFAQFLNEPVTTDEQYQAYDEIIEFLDSVPSFAFPDDLQVFLDENTRYYDTETIGKMLEGTKQSIENPEKFLSENKESLEQCLEFMQSDEYKNSPFSKVQAMLKEFISLISYYDIFIPAMKRLSKPYADYCKQLEIANEKLLQHYPEIE